MTYSGGGLPRERGLAGGILAATEGCPLVSECYMHFFAIFPYHIPMATKRSNGGKASFWGRETLPRSRSAPVTPPESSAGCRLPPSEALERDRAIVRGTSASKRPRRGCRSSKGLGNGPLLGIRAKGGLVEGSAEWICRLITSLDACKLLGPALQGWVRLRHSETPGDSLGACVGESPPCAGPANILLIKPQQGCILVAYDGD
jgi:hypothetical protein